MQEGVNAYEYMDGWKNLSKTFLPQKDFYSHLNMEDITDADYARAEKVVKILKSNILDNMMVCMFKAIHYC